MSSVRERTPPPASAPGGEPPGDAMTVEQLAAASGMSVRNIRNHQSRGLLPPPQVRARVGYYSREHLERLQLIADLQAEGFNLAAIERLIAAGGSNANLLGLRNAMAAPFDVEAPEVMSGEELLERFGEVQPRDIERVRRLGLLVPLGEDRFEVTSPALMRAAEAVTAMGIPLHTSLSLVERVSKDCESISRAFVKLYLDEVWEPFERAGQPEARWEEMIEKIRGLRAIASEALLAIFRQRMSAEVESASARLLQRQARKRR